MCAPSRVSVPDTFAAVTRSSDATTTNPPVRTRNPQVSDRKYPASSASPAIARVDVQRM